MVTQVLNLRIFHFQFQLLFSFQHLLRLNYIAKESFSFIICFWKSLREKSKFLLIVHKFKFCKNYLVLKLFFICSWGSIYSGPKSSWDQSYLLHYNSFKYGDCLVTRILVSHSQTHHLWFDVEQQGSELETSLHIWICYIIWVWIPIIFYASDDLIAAGVHIDLITYIIDKNQIQYCDSKSSSIKTCYLYYELWIDINLIKGYHKTENIQIPKILRITIDQTRIRGEFIINLS